MGGALSMDFTTGHPDIARAAYEVLIAAQAWQGAHKATINAPMGDKQVWKDLADAEASLSAAVIKHRSMDT